MKKQPIKPATFLFRLDQDWRKQLKITAAKNNTSIQKLLEEALQSYNKTKFKT